MKIFFLGYPGAMGGANTECWHTAKVWRQAGIEVTFIPTWGCDHQWETKLAGIGCPTVHAGNSHALAQVPGFAGSIVVSMCNGEVMDCRGLLKELGCPLVWVNCMTFLFDNEDMLCVSLRLSPKITYCYSCNHPSPMPESQRVDDWFTWRWRGASRDWGYPMSLDANIFRTDDLLPIMERLPWDLPNQLEYIMSANPLERRLMACREEHSVTNIPGNRVQGVFANRCMNDALTAAELNSRYLAGETIDLEPLAAMETDSCHFEAEYKMVPQLST